MTTFAQWDMHSTFAGQIMLQQIYACSGEINFYNYNIRLRTM